MGTPSEPSQGAGTGARSEEQFELFDQAPFQDGFNIKTIIGGLFVGFIMLPGAIYMGLVSGVSVGGAAQWVTIILFVEIAKRSFVRMSRQEIIILYGVTAGLITVGAKLGSAVAIFGGPIGSLVWNQYLVQSPQAEGFGVAHLIPKWFSPRLTSEALINRTFFHADWVVPISILVFHLVMSKVVGLSGGYFFYRVCNDMERLEFPLAPVHASAATALAESSSKTETWRWRVFSVGAMLGIGWAMIYLVLPVVTGSMLAQPIMIIPIPWWDLTDKIGTIMPAGQFGLKTSMGLVLAGFVLPFWVVIGQFVGATISDLILNPFVFHPMGLLHSWSPGMNVILTQMANRLDLWISLGVGLALVVAVIGLTGVARALTKNLLSKEERARTAANLARVEGRGGIPIFLALGIWWTALASYVMMVHWLVPTFNIWILALFAFIGSPILSYITARMIGITGNAAGVSFPYIREASFILSGYRGVAIWFAPVPLFNVGAGAQGFKQLELTRTKFVSTVKAQFAVILILLVCSFVYWSIIWRMAPIPSSTYPFVQKMWPLRAFGNCLWVSSTLGEGKNFLLTALRLKYVLWASAVGFGLYGVVALSPLPRAFFYGMLAGPAVWIHGALPMFTGALLGRYYFAKKFGVKRWRAYAPVLLAGFGCGFGLVAVGSVGIALIAKSVSQIVF